jgi:hypothetical protein
VHHFFAALSIILVGIHLGLHWDFVSGMLGKAIQLPKNIGKVISVTLLAAILVFGIYSIPSSGFLEWLTEPFVAETTNVEKPDSTEISGDTKSEDEKPSDAESDEHTPKKDEDKGGYHDGIGSGDKNETKEEQGSGGSPEHPTDEKKMDEGNFFTIINTIAKYLSILGVFTIITFYIDKLLKKPKSLDADRDDAQGV